MPIAVHLHAVHDTTILNNAPLHFLWLASPFFYLLFFFPPELFFFSLDFLFLTSCSLSAPFHTIHHPNTPKILISPTHFARETLHLPDLLYMHLKFLFLEYIYFLQTFLHSYILPQRNSIPQVLLFPISFWSRWNSHQKCFCLSLSSFFDILISFVIMSTFLHSVNIESHLFRDRMGYVSFSKLVLSSILDLHKILNDVMIWIHLDWICSVGPRNRLRKFITLHSQTTSGKRDIYVSISCYPDIPWKHVADSNWLSAMKRIWIALYLEIM